MVGGNIIWPSGEKYGHGHKYGWTITFVHGGLFFGQIQEIWLDHQNLGKCQKMAKISKFSQKCHPKAL